ARSAIASVSAGGLWHAGDQGVVLRLNHRDNRQLGMIARFAQELRPGCVRPRDVAAGVSPAVEGGILPPGSAFELSSEVAMPTSIPPGGTPGSTTGETPAATYEGHSASPFYSRLLRCFIGFLALGLCVLAVGSLRAAESIAILPGNFTLSGSAARQRLLVERFKDNFFAGQITNGIAFSSSDTNVLRIENDLALPLKNGAVTIRASAGKRTATAKVTVVNMDKPFEWSF